MNYKEYFKQQIVESIMEDTFAERQASHGDDAALEKAKYFKGLMSRLETRRVQNALRDMGPSPSPHTGDESDARYIQRREAKAAARNDLTGNPRVHAMSSKHMGAYPGVHDEWTTDRRMSIASFENPVEAGVHSPQFQKSSEERVGKLGDGARGARRAEAEKARVAAAAEARRKKFTI